MRSVFGFEPFTRKGLRTLLKNELKRRQEANSLYSLRAFAASLNVSHSTLSQFIRGQRKISSALLEQLIQKLQLGDPEASEVRSFHELSPMEFRSLSDKEINLTRSWLYPAVLEFLGSQKMIQSSEWVARRFGVQKAEIEKILQVSEELGWIKIKKNGVIKILDRTTSTLGQIQSKEQILAGLREFTQLQLNSLNNHPVEECSHVGLTVAINKKKLREVRTKIYEFMRDLNLFLSREDESKDDVYRLNISFFPLTQEIKILTEEEL